MWVLTALALVMALVSIQWLRSGLGLHEYLALGVVYLYARLWHSCRYNGPAPLPARGPAILVSNHTCSADPAFLTGGCARPLCFLVAGEFYRGPLLCRLFNWLGCVPVQRNGRDARSVRLSLKRLTEERVLCIFPEGGLSNAGRGRPRRAKAGVALLALRSRVPVFPARIEGGPQTSKILPAWLGHSRVRVTFGQALDLSEFYDRPIDRKLLEEVTRAIMSRIASLK